MRGFITYLAVAFIGLAALAVNVAVEQAQQMERKFDGQDHIIPHDAAEEEAAIDPGAAALEWLPEPGGLI